MGTQEMCTENIDFGEVRMLRCPVDNVVISSDSDSSRNIRMAGSDTEEVTGLCCSSQSDALIPAENIYLSGEISQR